ncbi:MAG: Holliday junction resolvase RuvX [Acutalibacteraceae bacterium]|nr:Holliday junction resolvase RuvX [Acutalibacteraceae bacterium]
MAVDLGLARTGIAVCDSMEILASPVCVINESYEPKLIDAICEKAKELRAEKIVVGLPKNMDGTSGERANECSRIGGLIGEKTGIPVVMQDERQTTVTAHNALNVTNVRGKKRKAVVDAVAAVIILQSYIDRR